MSQDIGCLDRGDLVGDTTLRKLAATMRTHDIDRNPEQPRPSIRNGKVVVRTPPKCRHKRLRRKIVSRLETTTRTAEPMDSRVVTLEDQLETAPVGNRTRNQIGVIHDTPV